ncbi:MAG: hypothetical protein FJY10_05795 [Bacteroidetes bacterium]|nr:hypothetical protein [Bacteroidota bacterium]
MSTGSATDATGASYSLDNGHTWQMFLGTETAQYLSTSWINNHCGWAGGFNVSATEGGMYKFVGVLGQTFAAPSNLQAEVTGNDVYLTWNAPLTKALLLGYNVYRDGNLLNTTPVTDLFYHDPGVAQGQYEYCVKAVCDGGISAPVCILVDVITGVGETNIYSFYATKARRH